MVLLVRVGFLCHGGNGRRGSQRRFQRARRRFLRRKGALLRPFAGGRGGLADRHRRRGGGEGGISATAAGRRVETFGLLGQSFGDGIVVDGQISQSVEYVSLPNDRVNEVGVACSVKKKQKSSWCLKALRKYPG